MTHKLADPFDFSVEGVPHLATVAYPKETTYYILMIIQAGCMNRKKSRPCFTQNHYYDSLKSLLLCSQHFLLDYDVPLRSSISINVVNLLFESSSLKSAFLKTIALHCYFIEFLSSLNLACNATEDIYYDGRNSCYPCD